MTRRGRRRNVPIVVGRLQRLLAAGVPTGDALAVAAAGGGPGAAVFAHVASAVGRGRPLSSALAAAIPLTDAELALIVAGERSGELARTLGLLDRRIAQRAAERRRLAQALVYPLVLLLGTMVVMTLMATVVLPSFAAMYDELGSTLPRSTHAVMWAGAWLACYGPAALALVATGAVLLAWIRRRSAATRRAVDRLALALPGLGGLLYTAERARLYAATATLLQAGVDLERALLLAAPSTTTVIMRERCDRVRRLLRSGARLSHAVRRSDLDRDGSDAGLLRVAEATGSYAASMEQLATAARDERDGRIAALTRIAEPAAVALVALIVGATVMAVYQPVLGSAALLAGGIR